MLCCFQKKNGSACYPLLTVAFIFMMSLILYRLFGRRYPVLSGQMPSYHVVRRKGVSYSGHPGSIMWVVTGRIGGDGNSCSQQSPETLLVNGVNYIAPEWTLIHSIWPSFSRDSVPFFLSFVVCLPTSSYQPGHKGDTLFSKFFLQSLKALNFGTFK
jgi:hypothetical protein